MRSLQVPLALTLAIIIAFVLGSFIAAPHKTASVTAAFPSGAELAGRTVVDFGVDENGTVSYSYLGDPVPQKIVENEIPELRSKTSYTKLVEAPKDGSDVAKFQTIIYAQPVYAKDAAGNWKFLEYATTTRETFNNRDMTLWKALTELVVHTAYADSVSPFSGAGDGYVEGDASDVPTCGSTWGTEAENIIDYTSTTATIQAQQRVAGGGCNSTRSRAVLPFDTSAIPSGSTVTAATLNAYVVSKTNNVNDGTDYLTVARTSQPNSTVLQGGDWSNISFVSEGIATGGRQDVTSITTSAYLVFTLNSTGLGWIALSGQTSNCGTTPGVSCFALVEGHDFTGSTPASAASGNIVTISTSENTGTSQDPYLAVTYTAPAAGTTAKAGVSFPAGSIQINSGGLNIRN